MAEKVKCDLYTPYSENMDKTMPWGEYPRPQFKRNSYINLNGEWDFAVSKSCELPDSFEEKILVPFPPESSLSGINRKIEKGEMLYYRRNIRIPEGFKKQRILIHIDACDQISEIYVNRRFVSKKAGGYTPHTADITDFLTSNDNQIIIKAKDDLDRTYPYGKQKMARGGMWYTPVSGIWQTVWLESLPENPIESIKITPSTQRVKIEVKTKAERKTLCFGDGERIEFTDDVITIKPKNPRLWTPEDPYIYYFTLSTETDQIESYFALREIGVQTIDGVARLCLNGKPYVFNGLLDQGYFPDGIFLPATAEGYRYDILLAKSLGFNMLRKHIKIEPPIFYHLCDKLGIAVFQDMINNSGYSFLYDTVLPTIGFQRLCDRFAHRCKKSREVFKAAMLEEAKILYNSPSILYYTIFNEGWGQFSADEMYRLLKSVEPTRIIDSTSGWFRQKESDVDSRHIYFKPLKIKKTGNAPLVISEFGGYAHRCAGHLFSDKNYGYKTFTSREDFEDAFIALYENEVLPLVRLGASGFVYTQLSDVEDETNGIVTYDRRVVKLDPTRVLQTMKKIQ